MTERSTTERGFTIYDEFTDTYGNEVRVQESSAATGAKVWIFCNDRGLPAKEEAPHLDVEQAKRLRDALDAFIRENATETTP